MARAAATSNFEIALKTIARLPRASNSIYGNMGVHHAREVRFAWGQPRGSVAIVAAGLHRAPIGDSERPFRYHGSVMCR
jgi:hypothetical protein